MKRNVYNQDSVSGYKVAKIPLIGLPKPQDSHAKSSLIYIVKIMKLKRNFSNILVNTMTSQKIIVVLAGKD